MLRKNNYSEKIWIYFPGKVNFCILVKQKKNMLPMMHLSITSFEYPDNPTSWESRIALYNSAGIIGFCKSNHLHQKWKKKKKSQILTFLLEEQGWHDTVIGCASNFWYACRTSRSRWFKIINLLSEILSGFI